VNDIGLDNQIIIDELRRIGFVGPDSAYLGRGKENILGLFLFKKTFHICLAFQIKLSVGTNNEVGVPLSLQLPVQRRTNKPSVTSYVYF
jgi:hypothetical protein